MSNSKQLIIAIIVALVVGYAVGKVCPLGKCNKAAACATETPVEGDASATPATEQTTAETTPATTETAPAATTEAPATAH